MVGDTTLSREGKSQRGAHKPEYRRRETYLRGDGIANIPTGGIPRLKPWEDVKYENGEHARGDYDLTVLTSNRVDNGQYHAETGSPRATYAIGTATVAYTYQTGDVKHTATVVVSPDE
ncbi:hypothetical protein [Natronomonas gomsonensis]|uniref:hypothetical protein n=1 Tax=Natronomonas gomsonensis TaxID=1046043 RepID=UPI0020CA47C8|nr:hypothetical protein [Natronomonas gomsonensis]